VDEFCFHHMYVTGHVLFYRNYMCLHGIDLAHFKNLGTKISSPASYFQTLAVQFVISVDMYNLYNCFV